MCAPAFVCAICAVYLGLIVFFHLLTCLFMCLCVSVPPVPPWLDVNQIAVMQSGKPSAPR